MSDNPHARFCFRRDRVLVVLCSLSAPWWCDWCAADRVPGFVHQLADGQLISVSCPECSRQIGSYSPEGIAVTVPVS